MIDDKQKLLFLMRLLKETKYDAPQGVSKSGI